jgi:TolB protein
MRAVLAVLAIVACSAALADRAPVLKQIQVPHDYYYREMYLPQLTSGPSAAAWSPDGKTLVYSMGGSLWKQSIDSTTAEELTDGPGYDYQPDWSPDGNTVAFVRYLHDAMELEALDLKSGAVTQWTRGGAVNLEPRWSPDGSRIAFVSTKGTGRFHIFIGRPAKAGFTAAPWSKKRKSKIARYYYSPFDQQLSPAWSPDGRALVYVDNPETGYGSGSLWRQQVDKRAPARLLHREETNWKAAPDWSPDGKRVIFSSYAGRQSNQLWTLTAAGDDYPLPLTFGEDDATRPRWSPDASRIAYISNRNKNTEIWIQEVIGGARRPLKIVERRYKSAMGQLQIALSDPARIAILGSDGRAYAPDDALVRGDDSFDRDVQPFETHYFQSAGAIVTLPPGRASLTVWYGDAHGIVRMPVEIVAGETRTVGVMPRKLDLPASFAAWRSADVHVHMNYGGTYRTEPKDLVAQAKAEDLDLVFDLLVNKEQRVPDIAYFSPLPDAASTPEVLLAHSQEYHSSYWGHLGILALDDHYIVPGYAGYTYTSSASLYPDNAAVADLAHAQNALVGYVHPFDVAPDPDRDAVITDELPIDVALGKVDYYEVVGFSNHRESASIWYRLLDCGFRLPAAAGTDG